MAQVGDGVSFSCCCFLQVPVGLLNWPGDTKVSKTKTVRGSGVTEVSELHILLYIPFPAACMCVSQESRDTQLGQCVGEEG